MYIQEEFESIQECYRHVFPVIPKELEQFWYPRANYDWLCLTSRFDESCPTTYQDFWLLGNDLREINGNQPPAMVGTVLANLARNRSGGYSIGLNPWADYFFLQETKTIPKEIIVIIAHNSYPLVTSTGERPDPPLRQRNPFFS